MLLDECVPQRFRHAIEGHEVSTVPHMGWASEKNGKLLGMAEQHFDVFVTTDQNLRHQQSIADFDLAVVVLEVQRNKLGFPPPSPDAAPSLGHDSTRATFSDRRLKV